MSQTQPSQTPRKPTIHPDVELYGCDPDVMSRTFLRHHRVIDLIEIRKRGHCSDIGPRATHFLHFLN